MKYLLGLSAGHCLQLNVIRINGGIGQGLVGSVSAADTQSLGNSTVNHQEDKEHKKNVYNKDQIQDGLGPELGVFQIALGGALNAADNV